MNLQIDLPITGQELKKVRAMLNYSASDVAKWLERHGHKPATVRGVYAMEDHRTVRSVLVPYLASLFGQNQLERGIRIVRAQQQAELAALVEWRRKRDEAERLAEQAEADAGLSGSAKAPKCWRGWSKVASRMMRKSKAHVRNRFHEALANDEQRSLIWRQSVSRNTCRYTRGVALSQWHHPKSQKLHRFARFVPILKSP